MQVETSGDAMYMTVSGAPVKNMRHAEAASAMALDMLEAVKKIKNPAKKKPMTAVSIGKKSTKCSIKGLCNNYQKGRRGGGGG